MHCFSINEPIIGEVRPGIKIFPSMHPMGLRWGALQPEKAEIVTVSRSQYKAVKALLDIGKIRGDTPCILIRADIYRTAHPEYGEGLRFEKEKDPYDPRALLYVYTPTIAYTAGVTYRDRLPDGAQPNQVSFTADTYKHMEVSGGSYSRIERIYDPFEEVIGIETFGMKFLQEGGAQWIEALLVLQPNASFRIVRGGDTRDLVPEFRITWSGYHLHTAIPNRYKSRVDVSS